MAATDDTLLRFLATMGGEAALHEVEADPASPFSALLNETSSGNSSDDDAGGDPAGVSAADLEAGLNDSLFGTVDLDQLASDLYYAGSPEESDDASLASFLSDKQGRAPLSPPETVASSSAPPSPELSPVHVKSELPLPPPPRGLVLPLLPPLTLGDVKAAAAPLLPRKVRKAPSLAPSAAQSAPAPTSEAPCARAAASNGAADAEKGDKVAKRQARLLRNREWALLSRQRRKEHLQWLEEHGAQLERENAALKEELNAVKVENANLKKELARVTGVARQPKRALDECEPAVARRSGGVGGGSKKARATGVTLLSVLLLLGLSFTLPGARTPQTTELVQYGQPQSSSVDFSHALMAISGSRAVVLKDPATSALALPDSRRPSVDVSRWTSSDADAPGDATAVSASPVVVSSDSPADQWRIVTIADRRSDTAYMLCADVRQFWPSLEPAADARPKISLLVPALSVSYGAEASPPAPTVRAANDTAESVALSEVEAREQDDGAAQANTTSDDGALFQSLLQIDCEVTSTRMVRVRGGDARGQGATPGGPSTRGDEEDIVEDIDADSS